MTRQEINKMIFDHIFAMVCDMAMKFLMSLPLAIIVGIIIHFITKKYYMSKLQENRLRKCLYKKILTESVLGAYVVLLIQISVLLRPIGGVHEIDLIPFNSPGGWQYIVLYAVANAVFFIPLGIFLPMIWKKMRKTGWALLAGLLGSLLIEVSQLLLQCGVFQTEDLIMNTLGTGMGYWLYRKRYDP